MKALSNLPKWFASGTNRWISENIFPGSEGGLSRLYPRVWTFSLQFERPFLEETRRKLSARESDEVLQNFSWDGVLHELVIDEYLNRLRVHRWTCEGEGVTYEMLDIDKSRGSYWNFDKHHGRAVWSYSTDGMNLGRLALSCSWERDPIKKQPYLQLILWLDYWRDREQDVTKNILFKLPLEPLRLCDDAGKKVYVQGQGGREFKAGDLDFYPYDEDDWKSPEAEEKRWRWFLHMKTFHDY
jgi:hypothetical protein